MTDPFFALPGEADIAVVVVTYQSASTIDDCLQRLRAAHGVAAIRVVDNLSSDGSLAIVQRHATADPRVRFIANPDNPGFALACNQGAADVAGLGACSGAGACRWLAFVNPDALVETDTLIRLRALAIARADVANGILLGADLVDEDGLRDPAARRRNPDFVAMFAGMPGALLRRFPDALRGGRAISPDRSANGAPRRGDRPLAIAPDDTQLLQRVDAVSGALMFLSRDLFERIGGFDEGYRLHAEDLDLCRRASAAGAVVAVANQVRVVHVRGVSSRSNPWFVEWHKHRGLWRYFSKFEADRRGPLLRAAVFTAIWSRFPFAVTRALLRNRS
ncbi:glycosyltransferase family 2 protein [Lysobacter sp. CW239]|uniref:glycosyltransferase n=1 Tax=Lysobacteraceae TaxID=32033 RepID=UPI00068CB2B7|nr:MULTISPECIES: glycosyltransferase family 2 protein [Lysobacter]QOD91423.1 glycosyltransferase family 2 protein [Lysobacter sp. CW239]